MKKKIVGIITAMTMLISTMPQVIVSAAEEISISTAAELKSFADSVNAGNTYEGKTVSLTQDIDLSEICGADINGEEVSWTPVGADSPFNGTFDGNGHTINGLYINSEDGSFTGLFGFCDENSQILNLVVDGSVKFGYPSFEGGWANPPIEIGGIAGASAGKIANCHNKAAITGLGNGAYAAGICGMGLSVVIENCINTGVIASEYESEAMVAFGTGYDNDNCYYLEGTSVDGSGAQAKTAEQFASGEVAYLLNNQKSEGNLAWYQNIGTDDYPVLDNTHSVVLYDGEKYYNDTKENDKINAYITRDFSYYASGLTQPIVIKSYDELKALVGDWRSNTHTDYLLEQYPQSFFENSFLYIRYIQGGPSDNRYKINSIENIDDTINIELEPLSYGSSDGFLNWFLFAETDRSLLDCDFNIIFKDFITVDSNQYHEGRPTHDVDFLPEDNLKLDYMFINSADELQSLWRGEQILSDWYANNPDRFFENYSLLFISWEEPQACRTKAVSSFVYSDKSIDITLSDNYNKEGLYADVITDYSAVIPISKTRVDNDVNINVRKINNNDLNNIAIKSITQTITAWQEKFYNVFFTMKNISQYSKLIAAVYEDGKLVGIKSMEITSDGFYSLSVKSESYLADNCKIFLWGSLDGMKPLREVIEHSL